MIILGLDTSKVNWYLVAYVLASIVFLVYGTTKVHATGETRGVLFGIGTFFVFLYFGFRWFSNETSQKTNRWPPVINMCPDYLTYVPKLGDSKSGCVDMLGVTTNGALLVTQQSSLASLASTNTQYVFPYTSADIKAAKDVTALQGICAACKTAGLTWEGVYDGDTCVGIASSSAAQKAAVEQCLLSV